MIHEVANRHGVPVVDTYYVLKNKPLQEIYRSPHHSKKGNEFVADLIAREIPMLAKWSIRSLRPVSMVLFGFGEVISQGA